jgi:hypothetical protein
MTIDMSQLAPYVWGLAAILLIIAAFIAIRFFWQHIIKYILQGCLVILGIIALLAVLHYYLKLF